MKTFSLMSDPDKLITLKAYEKYKMILNNNLHHMESFQKTKTDEYKETLSEFNRLMELIKAINDS